MFDRHAAAAGALEKTGEREMCFRVLWFDREARSIGGDRRVGLIQRVEHAGERETGRGPIAPCLGGAGEMTRRFFPPFQARRDFAHAEEALRVTGRRYVLFGEARVFRFQYLSVGPAHGSKQIASTRRRGQQNPCIWLQLRIRPIANLALLT